MIRLYKDRKLQSIAYYVRTDLKSMQASLLSCARADVGAIRLCRLGHVSMTSNCVGSVTVTRTSMTRDSVGSVT